MAQEWRATGGRSGLPVVDFGNVLRVPRRALEEIVGTELTVPAFQVADSDPGQRNETPTATVLPTSPRRPPSRRARPNQQSLFDSLPD
jgi:hypothetical protein